MKKQMDLLHGSIIDKMLKFAIPLAMTGILQQLLNAADVAIVGQFAGKEAMAAVGSNSPVISLIVNTVVGVGVGANVVAAKYIGSKHEDGISKVVHTSILFSLICGVVLVGICELAAGPIIDLLGVPADVRELSLLYLRVYLLGLPVIFMYNFEAAIFRSFGDTKTPLVCLIFAGTINVLLNIVFVCILGMSVDGVAIATVTSNFISAMMLMYKLRKKQDGFHLDFHKLRIDRPTLTAIVRIGVFAGLQSAVFSVANICVQSGINSLGSDVMAASAAAFNIEILSYYLLNSFGQASTTFVGQNYGAYNIERCKEIVRKTMIVGLVISVTFAFLLIAVGPVLLKIFTSDPRIIDIGMIRIKFILYAEALNVIMEVMTGAMRGYGYVSIPTLISFVGVCGTRITWIFTIFQMKPQYDVLMAVYPVSWVITSIALVVAYKRYMKRFDKKMGES